MYPTETVSRSRQVHVLWLKLGGVAPPIKRSNEPNHDKKKKTTNQSKQPKQATNRLFAEKTGWVGFLAVCFYINQSQPTKKYLLWKKWAQMPLLTSFFLGWVGLALRRGVRRFHTKLICFSTLQNLVNIKHPNQPTNQINQPTDGAGRGKSRMEAAAGATAGTGAQVIRFTAYSGHSRPIVPPGSRTGSPGAAHRRGRG